jgi:hypothetical protein
MRSQPHQQIAMRFLRAKCASPFGPRSSPESLTMNDQDAKRFPELYLNSAKYSLPTPLSQYSRSLRFFAAVPQSHGVVPMSMPFFVREDLAKGQFAEPFTAENHHQPPQYYLTYGFFSRDPVERPPGE